MEIAPDTRMGLVELSVSDLDRSLEFYEGLLGLTVLDRIHDLLGSHPQISLGNLGLTAHRTNVAPVATACYIVVGAFVTLDLNASLRTGANSRALRGVELRLSALNLLNAEPKLIRTGSLGGAPYDSTNQSPVGRFLGVSVRKAW